MPETPDQWSSRFPYTPAGRASLVHNTTREYASTYSISLAAVEVCMLNGQGSESHILARSRCAHQVHECLVASSCETSTSVVLLLGRGISNLSLPSTGSTEAEDHHSNSTEFRTTSPSAQLPSTVGPTAGQAHEFLPRVRFSSGSVRTSSACRSPVGGARPVSRSPLADRQDQAHRAQR